MIHIIRDDPQVVAGVEVQTEAAVGLPDDLGAVPNPVTGLEGQGMKELPAPGSYRFNGLPAVFGGCPDPQDAGAVIPPEPLNPSPG
ncbi:MAG: hypothetical protein ACOX4Q_06405 [Syntrophomonadales bacterium]